MKIYFAGSIRGGRDDAEIYHEIIKYLQQKAEVLTEHVGSASLTSMGEHSTTEEFIHDRDMEWVLAADMVIAEVTQPSLGVGYEIGRAIENGKPVYCLFRVGSDRKLSAMLRGAKDVKVFDYSNLDEVKSIIDGILNVKG